MPGPSCDARAFCRIGLIRQSDYFPTQPLTSASFSETHFLAASEAFVPFLISTITLAIWPGFHWNFLKKATTSGAFLSSFGFTMIWTFSASQKTFLGSSRNRRLYAPKLTWGIQPVPTIGNRENGRVGKRDEI